MYQYNKQQPRGIPGPTGPKGIDGKSIVFQGVWNNGTNYKKGDLVRDNDGNVYAALVDNVSYDPSSTPSVWGLFLQDGAAGSATDHGTLSGLSDDDHTQYSKADGTRAYTGKVSYNAHPTFITDTEIVDKKYVDDRDALKANLSGATFTGDIIVPGEVYGAGWNGSNEVPTKNDVYDKIESMSTGGATTLDGLTDVTIATPTNGQALIYETATSQWKNTNLSSGGDMLKATYDPTNVAGDAFDMDNMADGSTKHYVSSDQLAKIENGKILTSTDANTVTTGGRYGMIGTPTNGPVAGEFFLDVLSDGTRIMQTAVMGTTGAQYSRIYSGSWGSWVSTATGTNTGDQTTIVGITGTTAQFNTALTDGDFATLSGTETLTNKTLTTPKIGITKATTGDNVLELADGIGNGIGTSTLKITSRYDGVSDGYFEITTNTPATNGRIDIYAKGTGAVNISRLNATSPTFITPTLGTPASGTLTNCTGLPLAGVVDSTTEALGVGSLEVGHASDTTISRSSAGVIAVEGVVIPSVSSTNTLTNKRITQRVNQSASHTTSVTMDSDSYDEYDITAQAGALLFNNPSGTPTNCQKLMVRIKDNGTSRALTYGTQFASGAATLPTTTTISKKLWMGFEWDSTDSKWYLLATGVQP